MPNNNDNRENNKGCLEGLLEILIGGIFGGILMAIGKMIFEGILYIAAIVFVIYMIVTFLMNHV